MSKTVRLIARSLFYPTLWWNKALCRLDKRCHWWDWIDDSVMMGALPAQHHVSDLVAAGISAVVNTCEEYPGPVEQYKMAGIEQLHLPTVDFTPPSIENVRAGVDFIQRQIASGGKVYVHCKAGRGRSATIVICYLIRKGLAPQEAQELLRKKRPHVLTTLCKRECVRIYAAECGKAV